MMELSAAVFFIVMEFSWKFITVNFLWALYDHYGEQAMIMSDDLCSSPWAHLDDCVGVNQSQWNSLYLTTLLWLTSHDGAVSCGLLHCDTILMKSHHGRLLVCTQWLWEISWNVEVSVYNNSSSASGIQYDAPLALWKTILSDDLCWNLHRWVEMCHVEKEVTLLLSLFSKRNYNRHPYLMGELWLLWV